jgi:predicted nucleic acid-binding Zn ribbon protein
MGKKAVRKLYSNFAVTVYGGGMTVWRAHQLVTSYQYQCVDVERSSVIFKAMEKRSKPNCDKNGCKCKKQRRAVTLQEKLSVIHFTRFRVTR